MTISTSAHPKLLWPGLQAVWGDYFYKAHPSYYDKVFEIGSSKMKFEEDVQVTGFGLAPVKAEGSTATYDTEEQGPVTRYTHAAYALGFIVTHEELMDNQYLTVGTRRAKGLAFSMAQTVENVAFNVFNRAFNSSYTGGDGKEMCATDHPNTTGGTWSNELSTAADLSEASVEDLAIQIMNATNDRGLLIGIKPQQLIVSNTDAFNAERLLKSLNQSGTANNDINAIKSMGLFPKGALVVPYLTDTDAWFIKTDCPNGVKFLWREKPSFEQDNEFQTKNAMAQGYMRFVAGWTDPRSVYGTPGA